VAEHANSGYYFERCRSCDIIPNDDDPLVIFVIAMGRRVHCVLVNQGSPADVMF